MSSTTFIPPEVVGGTTTSWLPLTTAYPYVSGCSSAFFRGYHATYPVGWDPGYGYSAKATLHCLPPEVTVWWEQTFNNPNSYTRQSIQPIVCPDAFTTAATEVRDSSSTLIQCCPSNYDLQGGLPGRVTGQCYSSLTSGQLITYSGWNSNDDLTQLTYTATSSDSIRAIAITGYNVARSQSSTAPALPSSTSFNQSSSTQQPHGLSTGAKAGISVGAVLGVLTILCLTFFLFRERRKTRSMQYSLTPELNSHHSYKASEAQALYPRVNALPVELGTR